MFPRCLRWPYPLVLSPNPSHTHTSAQGAWEQTAPTYRGSTGVPSSSSSVLRGPISKLHNGDKVFVFILTMRKQQPQIKQTPEHWVKEMTRDRWMVTTSALRNMCIGLKAGEDETPPNLVPVRLSFTRALLYRGVFCSLSSSTRATSGLESAPNSGTWWVIIWSLCHRNEPKTASVCQLLGWVLQSGLTPIGAKACE